MSSSASLLLPSASLETRCSLDGCLLSPKLSTHNEELGCFSPRLPGLEQLKPTNASAFSGLKYTETGASGDKFSGEFDRGPAATKLRGTWQLTATGKPAAASLFNELKVQRIESGGPDGVKSYASKLIAQHQLDDTFYVVDLANVVRLFKTVNNSA